MRAAVFHEYGGPLSVEDVPDPTPPDDGVVVEVGASGVCRSDWHAWEGHDPDVAPPHVPGHELAGTVVAVGPEVRRVAVGERVTVPFCLGCGACASCRAGETQVCDHDYQPGFTGWGSWAQYVALPHADLNVEPLPEGLDFVDAAALGCRFMNAWAAVRVHGRVRPGEWVAVHGCGGIGLSAVMIATAAASVESLRKRGRHVQVGLMLGRDRVAPVPMARAISHELTLHGVHGMAVRHYPELLGAVAAGIVDPSLLVGATVPLEDAGAELAAMGTFTRTGATVITSF